MEEEGKFIKVSYIKYVVNYKFKNIGKIVFYYL